jgi:hypothetical protein
MVDVTYEPNWKNPQVKRRAITVFSFVELFMSTWRGTEISANELREVFGGASNPLTIYLRNMLLVQVSNSYQIGQYSKIWCLNSKGFEKLKHHLNISNKGENPQGIVIADVYVLEKFGNELATLNFQYNDSSNRLFHPLQNMKKEQKDDFWARHGLPFNYDIEACAPNILFQLDRKSVV